MRGAGRVRMPCGSPVSDGSGAGGTLLIVGHEASDFDENCAHRAHLVEKMFTIVDVFTAIRGESMHIDAAESRQRTTPVRVGTDFLHDIVVKASRPAT